MQFSDTSNLTGLIQECERICQTGTAGISGTTNQLKGFTVRINGAIDRFFHLAMLYSGEWQVDDTGNTTLPIATTDLVSGQYDYSFAAELLVLSKVLAANSAGTFIELLPVDSQDRRSGNIFTQPTGNNGIPTTYDVMGNSILLGTTPNYSYAGGLKVLFQRNGIKFTSGNTTETPGIPSLFHMYLARVASLPYLIERGMDSVPEITRQIAVDEEAIKDFYSNRIKYRKTLITPFYRSPR